MTVRPHIPLPVRAGALAMLLALSAVLAGCASTEDIPALERRAQGLNGSIMCPVCPGESIDQSQHPLAVQMRAIVLEKLEQGVTESQVRQYFVERYGPSVLLEPPRQGLHLIAWLVPPLGLALGITALYMTLRHMVRRRPGESDTVPAEAQLSEADRAVLFARIEAYEGLDTEHDGGRPPQPESRSAP